jgi:hypothetical protein
MCQARLLFAVNYSKKHYGGLISPHITRCLELAAQGYITSFPFSSTSLCSIVFKYETLVPTAMRHFIQKGGEVKRQSLNLKMKTFPQTFPNNFRTDKGTVKPYNAQLRRRDSLLDG